MQDLARCASICLALAVAAAPALADPRQGCSQDKDQDLAIRSCSELIEQGNETAKTYNNRGRIYVMRGDYARGIEDFTEALKRNSSHATAYNNRAFAYLKIGRPAQALLDAEKSLSLDPGNAEFFDTRGHILEALKRRGDAIADFRRALAKAPNLETSRDALKRLGASP
jgi:tetratricopeptide (TPR) repeat protein